MPTLFISATSERSDKSHCGARMGLDMCEISTAPVIHSRSCMRVVRDHPCNITDDQARACAATGGVIGITGLGIFLGPNTPTLDAMTWHREHAVDLVGIDHVGVSSEFSFDYADFLAELAAQPETLLTLGEHLSRRGWTTANIQSILAGNFYRVGRSPCRSS